MASARIWSLPSLHHLVGTVLSASGNTTGRGPIGSSRRDLRSPRTCPARSPPPPPPPPTCTIPGSRVDRRVDWCPATFAGFATSPQEFGDGLGIGGGKTQRLLAAASAALRRSCECQMKPFRSMRSASVLGPCSHPVKPQRVASARDQAPAMRRRDIPRHPGEREPAFPRSRPIARGAGTATATIGTEAVEDAGWRVSRVG